MHLDIDLRLRLGELQLDLRFSTDAAITAIVGESGAGKTTLLNLVAGLQRPDSGRIVSDGRVLFDSQNHVDLPAHRRGIGYVFQDGRLFPHLSVRQNLRYGSDTAAGWETVIDLLGLAPLLDRRVQKLSGGEKQRVAIGRALLSRPRLLLFDEPLTSLDARRKSEILPYLERLHETLDIPAIYVSHQPDEVARLADHLVLIDRGRVVASGRLSETLARLDLPAAFAADAGVVIDARFVSHDEHDHLTRLDFAGGSIQVPQRAAPTQPQLRCRIDARDVSLTLSAPSDTSILNLIRVIVVDHADTDHPAQILVRLDAGGTPLLARITRRSWQQLGLASGQAVWAQVKAVALIG